MAKTKITPEINFDLSDTESSPVVGRVDGEDVRGEQKVRSMGGRLGFRADTEGMSYGAGVSGGTAKGELDLPSVLEQLGAPDKVKFGSGKIKPQDYDAFLEMADIFGIEGATARVEAGYTPSDYKEDKKRIAFKLKYNFAKGGVVPMNNMAKQMEMFDDGGLMDEGGTVDPVSGNDVPPGSNQEEVRDDIPAQLSEGEFVFPADVVRYFGLEKLMEMRQEAKMGLQRMEDMGQMGNSEEAVMPDNLPFSIEDLDMEDDELEMAQGGVVHMANGGSTGSGQGFASIPPGIPTPQQQLSGVFYNPAAQSTTGVAAAPMQAASASAAPNIGQAATPVQAASGKPTMFTNYQLPQAPVPVMTAPDQLPKFLGEVTPGVGGVDYVDEVYENEAGETETFRRYTDGRLLDENGAVAVIPEGYKIKSEAEEDVGTGPVKVKTATVQDDGGSDNDDSMGDTNASIALGGTAVGPALGGGIPGTRFAGPSRKVVGSTLYDVSFKNVGMNPAAFSLNMLSKDGGLPPEGIGIVGVKGNGKAKIELPAVAYNSLRNDPRGKQAKAVQEALAARDALTSGNKASYVDGVLSVEDKNGNMVAVGKDAIDLIGSTMYSEIKEEADGTFGFGKTDNLVDTARDYYSGMNAGPDVVDDFGRTMSTEEKNARDALSAYNDQQFSNFVTENDSASDNNNDDGGRDYGGGIDDAAFDAFGDFAKGGLAKQMKRSGLASKK